MSVINFQKEIPHELMHALGLDHTFPENKLPNKKILFDEGSTKNYMDYNNKKEVTFKWQWDAVREFANQDNIYHKLQKESD